MGAVDMDQVVRRVIFVKDDVGNEAGTAVYTFK
jgi:hypothetical protein